MRRRLLRIIGRPYLGLSVITLIGVWTYLGDNVKENLCRIMAMMVLVSIIAKFCPMHDLGPIEKESSALGCFAAFNTPFSNLSGLNSSASSPHTSLSRWIVAIGIDGALRNLDATKLDVGTSSPRYE
uniref:Uncharacterized protein n=1 Tax=Oryza glumipatula TaxID=40148 RepID=A0A0E0AN67_9ORYZ